MYAIVRDRGKQHTAREGETLVLDPIDGKKTGDTLELAEVLLVEKDGDVRIGTPQVPGATVHAKIMSVLRGKKIDVVHFIRREDSHKVEGHRQPYITVKIEKIEA